LGQPAGVSGNPLRCGEPLQPPVVDVTYQVQRAPIQPADDYRARPSLRQRGIDVGRCQSAAAGADSKPRAARILSLYGEQPVDNPFDGVRRHPSQQLRRHPLDDHRDTSHWRNLTLRCAGDTMGPSVSMSLQD
jgi:hypothetical protein